MATKLSALIEANNSGYSAIHSFNNTWLKQIHELKKTIKSNIDRLLLDGEYGNFSSALADIPNHTTGQSAATLTQTLSKMKELQQAINSLSDSDTLSVQMDNIKTVMLKVDEIKTLIDKV